MWLASEKTHLRLHPPTCGETTGAAVGTAQFLAQSLAQWGLRSSAEGSVLELDSSHYSPIHHSHHSGRGGGSPGRSPSSSPGKSPVSLHFFAFNPLLLKLAAVCMTPAADPV